MTQSTSTTSRRKAKKVEQNIFVTESGLYRVRWQDGSGRSRSRQFDRLVEARAFRGYVVSSRFRGEDLAPMRISVGKAIDSWLVNRVPKYSPNTRVQYAGIAKEIVRPALGSRPIRSIKPADLTKLLSAEVERCSADQAKKLKSVLSGIWKEAVAQGWADDLTPQKAEIHVPWEDRNPDEGRVPRSSVISPDEFVTVHRSIAEDYRDFVMLLAVTGARISEICKLDCGDWDGESLHLRGTKSKASNRWLRVDDRTQELLDRLCAGRRRPDPIVTTPAGTRIDPDNFRKNIWNPLMDELSMPYKPHVLRHFCASIQIAGDVPLPEIARWLGHANPGVTARVYLEWFDEDQTRSRAATGVIAGLTAG